MLSSFVLLLDCLYGLEEDLMFSVTSTDLMFLLVNDFVFFVLTFELKVMVVSRVVGICFRESLFMALAPGLFGPMERSWIRTDTGISEDMGEAMGGKPGVDLTARGIGKDIAGILWPLHLRVVLVGC